jgi:predicted regulator of Ras-like GTPase activity (Roadblock/LC7/MglB family)
MSKSENLEEILKDLEASVPEIEAAAIVSVEGLPIASALPADVDETRVAAMTAAMLSLGERAAQELGKGELEQVFIRGNEGYIFVMNAGANAVLTVSTKKDVKLGLIFLDMRRSAQRIAELI